MRSIVLMVATSVALVGCGAPESRDSRGGDDYFDTINQTQAQREAEARRIAGLNTDIVDSSTPLTTGGRGPNSEPIQREIDRLLAAEGAGATLSPTPSAVPQAAAPAPATPQPVATAELSEAEKQRISNSQDFEAVTARETIETDAAKLEELKRTYQVFEPESLTLRGKGVSLASYAVENANRRIGKKRFTRRRSDYKDIRNFCGDYAEPDLAQIAFLNRGGPKKDPLLLDRDGDGFACNWTPQQYQARLRARQQAQNTPAVATPLQ